MFKLIWRGLLTVLVTSLPIAATSQDSHTRPASPPAAFPNLDLKLATTVCVNCDQPFEFEGHEEANKALLQNPYIQELRRAMYLQDTYHQFESRAHFDNCAFREATRYVADLLQEVSAHAVSAQKAQETGEQDKVEAHTRQAFFSLGQALHAVQDFYAHSNYVELVNGKYRNPSEIPILKPWVPSDVARIGALEKEGLRSGFVFWGFPQSCAKGSPSHADLAKDSATTKSGKLVLSHLENLSQYKVALFLAREASKEFMNDAFTRWPILAKVNGKHVAFEIFQERRGI